jgi:hypothetical protein
MFKLSCVFFLLIHCCALAAEPDIKNKQIIDVLSTKKTMEYRYWDLGASSKRDNYQRKLLELALEKSSVIYGSYAIIKVNGQFTSVRATREVSRGEIINIEASPYKPVAIPGTPYSDVNLITIDKPILKNLLGYRQLVVRKDKLNEFYNISEAALS